MPKSFAVMKWPNSCSAMITPKNRIANRTGHTLPQIAEIFTESAVTVMIGNTSFGINNMLQLPCGLAHTRACGGIQREDIV